MEEVMWRKREGLMRCKLLKINIYFFYSWTGCFCFIYHKNI